MEDTRIGNELRGEIGTMMLSSIIKKSLIKATDTYATPPQIIWVDSSVIATLGNFSASTGKAKAKKTFNVSAIVAAALTSSQVLNYRAQLPDGKQRILYVDTEQSRYHCHKVLERILRLAGLPTDTDSSNLDFLCLREYSPATRIQVIEYALSQNDSYGLVIIDGIRDLLVDINNAGESTVVINKMMEWSSRYDLHIHCVLHQNKADNNVRGHIGTEMNNKAAAKPTRMSARYHLCISGKRSSTPSLFASMKKVCLRWLPIMNMTRMESGGSALHSEPLV